MKILYCILSVLICTLTKAQVTYPVNGTEEKSLEKVLYVNANIQVNPEKFISLGCIYVVKGKIKGVYETRPEIKGLAEIDLKGAYVYSSFIDLYSNYGQPKLLPGAKDKNPQFISDKSGAYHWNEAVHPEYEANAFFKPEEKKAALLRKMGFGLVVTHQADGIFRGTGCLVNTAMDNEGFCVEKSFVASVLSFYKGSSSQDNPRSQMGAIALIRQTFYDASWNKTQDAETNLSLDAINRTEALPMIFAIKEPQDVFRVQRIAEEFDQHYLVKASGYEYRWAEELKSVGDRIRFILPLHFDKAPKVSNPLLQDVVSTTQLYDYFYSPYNAKILEQQGLEFCFTQDKLKSEKEFFKALRTLKATGLSESAILSALTLNPAKFIGQPELGMIRAGNNANFFICDASIFDEQCRIMATVIKDKMIKTPGLMTPEIRGRYELIYKGDSISLDITGPLDKPSIKTSTATIPASLLAIENPNSVLFKIGQTTYQMIYSSGSVSLISQEGGKLEIQKLQIIKPLGARVVDLDPIASLPSPYLMDYEYAKVNLNSYAIKNVTIWTCEAEGIIEGGTVLIKNGKISAVGEGIDIPADLTVIDGTAMHLSPGLIDEHSHIAIYRGVNEGTQAVTAEVRIGDVLNAQDVNIYRQLAGGVTTSHLLHGSANPIGGQTELIKLRYGMAPEALKFDRNFKFIKFALGENVKQTNWGDHQTVRYPQTRMGVEQVFVDAFTRARSYRLVPENERRKDLELDAIVEILESKRFITCHSYQQGEINMLIHVADSFGFRVNTFTHVLEGYKVADKIKAHGAAASTFADWWAYKFEVRDAIPYNAAILTQVGVLTAINSDDAEMGRRLNQEAAKAMKYGGLSEIQALNLVTINPAKMLHIDHRVGSIKVGKDADLVLWTDHPLSVYAQVNTTFVDGVIYYSHNADIQAKLDIEQRRAAMIVLLANEKQEAEAKPEDNKLYHCDDNEDENR